MRSVSFRGEPGYEARLGRGLLGRMGEELRPFSAGKLLIAVDRGALAHLPALKASLEGVCQVFTVLLPGGERAKSLFQVRRLWAALERLGFDRTDAVTALGGGAVCDAAGFAAATYLRGIRCFLLPTTLLGQVDASVGGKTAINLRGAKNRVGCFASPAGVWMDFDALKTLPAPVYRQGLAEIVKAALLADAPLFERLEAGERAEEVLVERAILVKRAFVEEDFRDQGRRAALNLGHTFAHAIEARSHFGVSHGDAVAIGLCLACALSERMGRVEKGLTERVSRLLRALGLPTETGILPKQLCRAMVSDKKRRGGSIRFVLPEAPGKWEFCEIPVEKLPGIFGEKKWIE